MNLGILSGKGGTGKTTVATNLTDLLKANYVDCDVEEPNGFIFLEPVEITNKEVQVDYPYIDEGLCVMCGACVDGCQFNALARVKKDIVLFQKLCHSCGACEIVCKEKAITYKKRGVGVIEEGKYKESLCKRGLLNVGEPMAVPIITTLLSDIKGGSNIIDFPPGTSCNVVNALQYMDAVILVTEPTKFGLHDLKMAVKLVRMFELPLGVIINKHMEDEREVETYCIEEGIDILGRIPYNREIARCYSEGKILVKEAIYRDVFQEIERGIRRRLGWS